MSITCPKNALLYVLTNNAEGMAAVTVQDGTYEQLIARGGKFAQLVERQRLDT